MLLRRSSSTLLLLASCASAAILTGCGMATSSGSGASTISRAQALATPATFGGSVYGGNNPVTDAVVTLWAAGTTGYGTGATPIATTVTDAQGGFNLNPQNTATITGYTIASGAAVFATGTNSSVPGVGQTVVISGFSSAYGQSTLNGQEIVVTAADANSISATVTFADQTAAENGSASYQSSFTSACTTGQHLYITAVGGNPGLAGNYGASSNASLALMAALPAPCSASTGSSYVIINEPTTIAAVWALQQFMTLNPAGSEPTTTSQATPPWTIGAPSANQTGLTNAFLQTPQLVNSATGKSAAYIVTNTVGTTVYSTTVTPNTTEIYTLADVLAYCVNSSGSNCPAVFTATTPTAGTYSGKTPLDTIQSAYYIATNPTGVNSTYTPQYLCTTFVQGTGAPFTAATCTTSPSVIPYYDWNIGVIWRTVDGSANVYTTYPGSVAVDASGNIWTASGAASGGYSIVNEFDPTGRLLQAVGSGATASTVTIPTANQSLTYVTYSATAPVTNSYSTTLTSAPIEYTRSKGLAIDTSGNAWVGNSTESALFSQTVNTVVLTAGVVTQVTPATSTGATTSTAGTASGFLAGETATSLAFDASNNLWLSDNPSASAGSSISLLTAASSYHTLYIGQNNSSKLFEDLEIDSTGQAWAMDNASSSINFPYRETVALLTSSTASTANINANNVTGTVPSPANYPSWGALDASNNLWGSSGANATGGIAYYSVSGNAATVSPSISGSIAGNGAVSSTGGMLRPTDVAIDGTGNVWVLNHPASGTVGGISEFTSAGVAISPNVDVASVYGFNVDGNAVTVGFALDSSGNIWLANTGGSSFYHMVGLASPIITPKVANLGHIGTKPM